MSAGPLDVLASAAEAGDTDASVALGVAMLGASPTQDDARRGVELLLRAADGGHPRACSHAAVLAGAGVGRPQSWDEALDYLLQAAEGGWASAAAQLALLAGVAPENAGGAWARLRAAVDVERWITPPPKHILLEDPRLRVFEDFASPAICAWLVECARNRLSRAHVYDADSGGRRVHQARTNSETDFNIVECDLVLILLRARIAAAAGLPPAVMELTKVLHYAEGQRFDPHFDFIDPGVPGFAGELAMRGQRLATFLLYLNDDYEGGETEFPRLGLRHRGGRGAALMFANVNRAGQPDQRTLHSGLPPSRGEKWLLSQWIRDRIPGAP